MKVEKISFAVIGGSEAYGLLQDKAIVGRRIEPVETPFGASQPIFHVESNDLIFLFMSRHGEKGYLISAPFVNYRANIYALKELGADRILTWTGPGALNTSYKIGQFVVPEDVIDETKGRKNSFYEGKGLGFIRQGPVFCPDMTKELKCVLKEMDLTHSAGGTYVCTEGPRMETAAEIRKYRLLGADMVGMTIAPECFLARELEMCYLPLCYITNYAEGIRSREYVEGVLFEGLIDKDEKRKVDEAVSKFPKIIISMARRLRGMQRNCPCSKSMERYKKRGDISEDWHEWVRPNHPKS